MIEAVKDHGKKYGAAYMINVFGSIIPILMFLGFMLTKVDGYSTDSEVDLKIAEHTDRHRHTHQALEKTVDNIYLLNLETRIEKLLRVQCESPGNARLLEDTVKKLILEYNEISDNGDYRRPSCQQLKLIGV